MSATVGMVTDSPAVSYQIRTLMEGLGQTVAYTLSAEQAFSSNPLHPTMWIVISEQAADVFETLSQWSDAPILLAENLPAEKDRLLYNQWKTSLCKKISKTLEATDPVEFRKKKEKPVVKETHGFDDVWVLASSLGGPEAVRVFLAHVDAELPITFVYAQHIEKGFDKMLPNVVGKNSNFKVEYCSDGETLRKGSVTVIPSYSLTTIDAKGRFSINAEEQWMKPYTPNIDQVIDNVGEFFKDKMGIIIFSGMCDDGAAASIRLKSAGVPLWAQKPEDCICSSMPESVIKTGKVDFIGDAEELAVHLNELYKSKIKRSNYV